MALPLSYNWRNLFVRKTSTLLTFGVVALIVLTLTWALAFGHGLESSMEAGGSDQKIVVIKPGATGESSSLITKEEFDRLTQVGGVAVNERGEVLRSGELITQIALARRESNGDQNAPVAVRGVEPIAFEVHSAVRLTAGRAYSPGTAELIVGRAIQARVRGLELNDEVSLGYLGNRRFRVVGVFEAGGGPLESEVWGPLAQLRDAFGRTMYSSVSLRAASPSDAQRVIDQIKAPPHQLNAKTERLYYRDIAEKSTQIVGLTLLLVLCMALGACFAVANTTFAAVDGRTREIAMLRTIGYSRRAIVCAFLIESVIVCGSACLLASIVALFFQGQEHDYMPEATWSTITYQIQVTPAILAKALAAALAVAVVGAVVPAVRAARLDIIAALRQA